MTVKSHQVAANHASANRAVSIRPSVVGRVGKWLATLSNRPPQNLVSPRCAAATSASGSQASLSTISACPLACKDGPVGQASRQAQTRGAGEATCGHYSYDRLDYRFPTPPPRASATTLQPRQPARNPPCRVLAPRRAAVLISSARAEASCRNGAKSRGPKTPEGKARSAQNAHARAEVRDTAERTRGLAATPHRRPPSNLAPNEPEPDPIRAADGGKTMPRPLRQARHGFPGSHGPSEQMPNLWLRNPLTISRLGQALVATSHRIAQTHAGKRAERTRRPPARPPGPILATERTRARAGIRSARATRARSRPARAGRAPGCRTNPRPGSTPHSHPPGPILRAEGTRT